MSNVLHPPPEPAFLSSSVLSPVCLIATFRILLFIAYPRPSFICTIDCARTCPLFIFLGSYSLLAVTFIVEGVSHETCDWSPYQNRQPSYHIWQVKWIVSLPEKDQPLKRRAASLLAFVSFFIFHSILHSLLVRHLYSPFDIRTFLTNTPT